MTIRDYIKDQVFDARAAEFGCLVIYDPARRYQEIAMSLDSTQCRGIDTATSITEQREAASEALRDLSDGKIHRLVLWVPSPQPTSEEERQRIPLEYSA